MKKLLTIVMALALAIVACVFCGNTSSSDNGSQKQTVKAGLITLHDENSTYDKNFIDAFKAACTAKGIDYTI